MNQGRNPLPSKAANDGGGDDRPASPTPSATTDVEQRPTAVSFWDQFWGAQFWHAMGVAPEAPYAEDWALPHAGSDVITATIRKTPDSQNDKQPFDIDN